MQPYTTITTTKDRLSNQQNQLNQLSVIIWNLAAANKKQHMGICSSDATTGMWGGGGGRGERGREREESRGERLGVVRDIPSVQPAPWVFPCFNKAEFRHFKELTPAVPRSEPFDPSAPAGEEGARAQAAAATLQQTRQVASSAPLLCCYNLCPSSLL